MKISLVVPSNRTSNTTIARILEWSSLDSERFELVVRDNSEDERKHEWLARIQSPALKLRCVPACSMGENVREAMDLATGQFVFCAGDDDWLSLRAFEQLHTLAEQWSSDASVGCLTGCYLVETSQNTGFFRYSGLDAVEAEPRIANYLQANTTNFLFYSAVRRSVLSACLDFMSRLPYSFSYVDQLMVLVYLALGRVMQIERVHYSYDMGPWESAEGSLNKDRIFYRAAGLPIEYDRLHHLFCGLEGALLLKSNFIAERTSLPLGNAADIWFRSMFAKFRGHNREFGYERNAADEATRKLKETLLARRELDMHELLLDVSETLAVADPAGAERYFKFWSTL